MASGAKQPAEKISCQLAARVNSCPDNKAREKGLFSAACLANTVHLRTGTFSINRLLPNGEIKPVSPLRGLSFIPNLSQHLRAGLLSSALAGLVLPSSERYFHSLSEPYLGLKPDYSKRLAARVNFLRRNSGQAVA
jgi:hypothetical protein